MKFLPLPPLPQVAAARPSLPDEEVYQRARRVLIAEMQNIVYSEFLPAVLGRGVTGQHLDVGRGTEYRSDIDPSIVNSFATAAFRFGHSLIQGRVDKRGLAAGAAGVGSYLLRDNFFSTENYFDKDGHGWEKIISGIVRQPSQEVDNFVTEEVTLFQRTKRGGERTDLVAKNIQRGRDHGLPGYNAFREAAGMEPACSWQTAPPEIPAGKWRQLSRLYEHPDDVDLFAGGLAEEPYWDGAVGRTFSHVLAWQFRALMLGDRFFFSHRPGGDHGLSSGELRFALRRTLARVICDNTDIAEVPQNVFLLNSVLVRCQK